MSYPATQNLNQAYMANKTPALPLGCDIRDWHPILRPLAALLTVILLSGPALSVHAQLPAPLPADPNVIHGSATFDTIGNHMTVINSPDAILDWQSFSIDANHGVHFQQLNAASQVLNRVTGNDPSQILGSLSSNGGVWLINPHGVLFGQNARIDVAGLVASTLDISNVDFLASKYNFLAGGGGPGQVLNQGEVRTTFGGRVWMIGEQVRNEGLIQTAGGNIVLAAGKSLELIDSGAPNVIVRVTAPENEAANLGSLVASSGGSIDIHGSIVNQQGIVRADSIGTDAAGRILLKAGQGLTLTENSETRADGGNVTLAAGTSTYLAGLIDVSRQQGAGGSIQLTTGKLEGVAGGSLRADGDRGGHIQVEGRGMVGFSSTFSATGNSQGGSVNVTGDSVYLLNADINASGGTQGGTVHLGGGWQGGGDLPHAREVLVGTGSEVKANGSLGSVSAGADGRGGEIVVWSTQSSQHYGMLQARDGGRVELSSRGEIRQTGDIQAGPGGTVLFDPKNLIIIDSPPDSLALLKKITGDTYGAAPADQFGFSIAQKDDLIAIGARDNINGGAVYLFTGVGLSSGLTLKDKLQSSSPIMVGQMLTTGAQFGASVALADDRLAVGAPGDTSSQGAVYLFSGVGTDFTGLTSPDKLASNDPILTDRLENGDQFGFSVALEGDRLAVGANGDDTVNTNDNLGAVYLFRGVSGNFNNLGPLEKRPFDSQSSPSTTDPDVFFGRAVALKGDLLAVGAAGDDTGGLNKGAVYLYTGVMGNTLILGKKLAADSGAGALTDNGLFGWSVAFDSDPLGDRLVVGASGDNDLRGAVYLYSGVGTDFILQKKFDSTWDKLQSPPDRIEVGDRFGYSVSLSGDRLIVGAVNDDDQSKADSVYFFTGMSTFNPSVVAPGSATTFAADPSGTSYITPASITSLLNVGSFVTLQANNDITVSSPISTNEGDGGGDLTLQAGRNITFGANITTDNGNLTAVAGDSAASAGFKDPGTPTLTIANGVNLNVGAGTATLVAVNGNFINNNIDGLSPITAGTGRWLIYAADPASSVRGFPSNPDPDFPSSSYNKRYGESFTPGTPFADSGNWFLYSVIPTLLVTPSGQIMTYGDTVPGFSASFNGFIDGDTTAVLGDSNALWTVSGGSSSSGNSTAGVHNVVYNGGFVSDLGYQFADNTASSNELAVNTKGLDVGTVTVQNKIYDGTTAAPLSSSGFSGVVSGDLVDLSAALDNKNVGVDKPVTLALSGSDSVNYTLAPFSPSLTADIIARSLTANDFTAQDKVYDGNIAAIISGGSLLGLVTGDTVSFSGATGAFDSKNVGINKTVSISGISLGGVDGGNYTLSETNIATTTADITPATLIYAADPATGVTGAPVNGLTGAIIGLQGTDTLQNDTAGTLLWTTPATAVSPAGNYAINGSGLTATNYIFEQAASNASALTVLAGIDPVNNPQDKQNTLDTSVQSINVAMAGAFPVLDWSALGFVIDMTLRAPNFGRLDLSRMSRAEMQQLIDTRREFKEKLFADAIYKLEQDPSLANVRPCPSLADVNTGLCRMTDAQRMAHASQLVQEELHKKYRKTKVARLPQIERKFVVLFGIDQYADKTIPPLENAIFDAEVVGKLLADKLGYEVNVVKNATKADIVRTLNQLSTEMQAHDSVIIYYAGHGYRNEKTGGGYWIPADASVTDPATWVSNTDVSKMLSDIRAKQMVMISDSCYSGTFAEQKLGLSGTELKPDEVLAKRSVVVMSSGGDEPVADEGKEGHSIFAWDLMQALRKVDNWQPATSIFEQVKRAVMVSFPQIPQIGSIRSAGHEANTDYLFEFRELEEVR